MTPHEALMDMLTGCDDITELVILARRESGTKVQIRTGKSEGDMGFIETVGLLRFAQISSELDLKASWGEQ